jgi:hypothetical protein
MDLVDCSDVGSHFLELAAGNLNTETESCLPISRDFATQLRVPGIIVETHTVKAVLEAPPELKSQQLHLAS